MHYCMHTHMGPVTKRMLEHAESYAARDLLPRLNLRLDYIPFYSRFSVQAKNTQLLRLLSFSPYLGQRSPATGFLHHINQVNFEICTHQAMSYYDSVRSRCAVPTARLPQHPQLDQLDCAGGISPRLPLSDVRLTFYRS